MLSPIIAISTSLGKSAIGIIRISFGSLELKVIDIFLSKIFKKNLKIRYATYVSLFNKKNFILDKGIAIFFNAPNSYTGENILEFHGHGNFFNLRYIVKYFLLIFKKYKMRIAKPGEFTKRAFFNKKLNLIQAENILNIINSADKLSLRSSHEIFKVNLSLKIKNIIILINEIHEYFLKNIDFFYTSNIDINYKLNYILRKISNLRNRFLYKNKVKILSAVLLGNTNVGKSTIVNRLLKSKSILVSSKPGTTRDVIEKSLKFKNFFLNIKDTAGLRNTKNKVERMGIRLGLDQIINSSIIIYVFGLKKHKIKKVNLKKYIKNRKFLLKVFNKIDLLDNIIYLEILFIKNNYVSKISLSAKNRLGINLLFYELNRLILLLNKPENFICSNNIFNNYLSKSYNHTLNSLSYFKSLKIELLLEELNLSKYFLGCLINFKDKKIINKLFKNFCIGK